MNIHLDPMSSGQILALLPQIVRIYERAFTRPPYNKPQAEISEFAEELPTQLGRRSFQFVGAFTDDDNALCGFTYGYDIQAGQKWPAIVRPKLPASTASYWLDDSFQLVEIAVDPASQGRGIGAGLHDHLINGLQYERAVLLTLQAETVAQHLYRRRGWVVLREDLHFPGINRQYQLMGRELTAQQGADGR